MQSEIKTDDKTGKPFLIVFYDPIKRDWDKRIKEAAKHHNIITKNIHILVKPAKGKNDGSKSTEFKYNPS